jgi:hypothetical protein
VFISSLSTCFLGFKRSGPGCAHFPIVPLLMHCDSLLVDHFLPLGDQHIALLSESASLVCYELLGVTFLSA